MMRRIASKPAAAGDPWGMEENSLPDVFPKAPAEPAILSGKGTGDFLPVPDEKGG